MSSPPSKRRFKAEPIETTTKSSRKDVSGSARATTGSTREVVPEPTETSTKPTRRFAPQPIETSASSSRSKAEPDEAKLKAPRRFAPQPVETSVASSRDKREFDARPANIKSARRFAPQPVETTTRSNRKGSQEGGEKKPRRKFAPQLIETAKRSRKSGDMGPALLPSDKTEVTSCEGIAPSPKRRRPGPAPVAPVNTPTSNPQIGEARRLGVPVSLRRDSRHSERSHSFRVPDLDPIESSQSEEEEGPPSLSTSPSSSESERSAMYKDATRIRESVDERFSGFLLEIAAKAAAKQMREQVMAAFPNDDHHEPVAHFITNEDEEDEFIDDQTDGMKGRDRRESSFTQVNWELLAMQKHQEKRAEEERLRNKELAEPSTKKSPWGNPFAAFSTNARGRPETKELEGMQKSARPPMLGGDIEFPRCPSPEPARFDVTQGSDAVRNSMCYLTEQTQQQTSPEGLWATKKTNNKTPSLWEGPGSRPPSRAGLWGGCCLNSGHTPPRGQTGMLTPMREIGNPFDSPPPTPARAPPSPPPSNPDFQSIDEKLHVQRKIEEEFDDGFVTQVYNYLSLGYPSLARKYDDELSKISQIPIAELRQDDELAKIRGYIRLGDGENGPEVGIEADTCARWRALRTYIFEWAKQQPRMIPGAHALGGFGVAARRGSWAW
ncbi:hypothetical protein K490DRAFT_46261 [Saccharata proteae CBS 121410]|uniref:Uncharacterized protein n=1 Tax=Saccharata proteae CBS 121410 TaxID=1314787 RepID=A0A9P4HTL8_9PEZI|nr:hypothetical protein K490DRAFT_46261 [Saccharata proteae CBS 121410]